MKTKKDNILRKPHTFRLPAELLNRAREQAEKENRTLTNWIETTIRKELHI